MNQSLIKICQQAVSLSRESKSSLPQSILDIEGMSSDKVRHMLSNLTTDLNSYIEIGVWKGSTFLSATHGKMNLQAVAIDNWSEFGGPVDTFKSNLWKYRKEITDDITLFESDFHNVQLPLNHFQCLFYDGSHDEQAQCDAIVHMSQFMHDEFIYVVDDYCWPSVSAGTVKGLKAANLEVEWEVELESFALNDRINYWNGMLVSVLKKMY